MLSPRANLPSIFSAVVMLIGGGWSDLLELVSCSLDKNWAEVNRLRETSWQRSVLRYQTRLAKAPNLPSETLPLSKLLSSQSLESLPIDLLPGESPEFSPIFQALEHLKKLHITVSSGARGFPAKENLDGILTVFSKNTTLEDLDLKSIGSKRQCQFSQP